MRPARSRRCAKRSARPSPTAAAAPSSAARPATAAGRPEELRRRTPRRHIPDICHSTILRWSAEPEDRAAARAAFARAAANWEAPVAVDVARVAAVYEEAPFMHGASEFWASDG